MAVIDKSSYIPYYRQLVDLLRGEIHQKQAAGERYQLPSENDLAERHGLSRATVRHALDELERQGWIYKQKGVGSFAPARRVEQELTHLVSTTEDMRQRGWNLQTRLLSLRQLPAPAQIAEALNLAAEARLFELRRLRLVDGAPASLQTAYLPAELCPTLEQDDLTASLYNLLESRYGLRLWTGREMLRARAAAVEEAELLDTEPGAPVMYAERITYAVDGTAVEYLEAVWRGDCYDFKVSLARPGVGSRE